MNTKKMLVGLAASVALAAIAAGPSLAAAGDQQTFAGITTVINPNEITYTGSSGLNLTNNTFNATYTPTGDTIASRLFFVALSLQNNGALVLGPGGVDTQPLTGGQFAVISTAPGFLNGSLVPTGSVLLEGSFSEAALIGTVTTPASSTTANLKTVFNDLVYQSVGTLPFNGGLFFQASGLTNPGAFSFGLTSLVPALGLQGSGVNTRFTDFTASGTGTFSATTPVPEPTTVASFGFGGFGLLGLMVRARKARKTIA